MTTHDDSREERLRQWSQQHALLMLLALSGAVLEHSAELAAAIAAGSFLGLLLRFRGDWTPSGRLGWANIITTARLTGSLALLLAPAGAGGWPAALAALVLLGDGLDGWAARRAGDASPFGHAYDQDVDAFFLLALCLQLFLHQGLGDWILVPGSLRYVYLVYARFLKRTPPAGAGNRYTRAMGSVAMGGLSLCLLPLGPAGAWLAAGVAVGIAASFLHSFLALHRPAEG